MDTNRLKRRETEQCVSCSPSWAPLGATSGLVSFDPSWHPRVPEVFISRYSSFKRRNSKQRGTAKTKYKASRFMTHWMDMFAPPDNTWV